jgi:hypothetical protein
MKLVQEQRLQGVEEVLATASMCCCDSVVGTTTATTFRPNPA